MRKDASRPDAENPEWTEQEIREARPLMDVLPKETAAALRRYRGQRGPQKKPTKQLISLRVDRDIVAAYRSTGSGWQTRANDALRAYATKRGLVTKSEKTADQKIAPKLAFPENRVLKQGELPKR